MIYWPIEVFLVTDPLKVNSLPLIAEVRFQKDYFSKYPQEISVGKQQSTVLYSRKPGYYAVHSEQPGTVTPEAVLELNEGAIAVFQGEPNQAKHSTATLSPVYALQPSNTLAVPTGQVFIRFGEGIEVESQREAINKAGYEVVQRLSYAPHAAWLRHRSGNIYDALTGIDQLQAIPGVENVEPQMLMERSLR
jgi:hypothetical protein